MKKQAIFPKALGMFLAFTLICGVGYTALVTGLSQVLFPAQANGSIIEVDGVKYGSSLLGQTYTDNGHMWGRIQNLDVGTFTDENGNPVVYSWASNLSPAGDDLEALVAERVAKIKAADPENTAPIPVDLVTCSGSGLDPHISVAAAEYQVGRIAAATGRSEAELLNMIADCTDGKFLGVFGENVVNVLEFNLMLDGIL